MATDLKPAALPEEQVRQHVNRWNGDGFFRIKNLGDKIFVEEIAAQYSYTTRLRTQYEERTISKQTVPYSGGHVDDRGRPPEPWDIHVRRPEDFEDRTEHLPVPHTEQVHTCSSCAGVGTTGCATCGGSGRVSCPFCHGKGVQVRQEMRSEKDANGNPVMRPVTVEVKCTCFDGTATCNHCGGNGRLTCGTCAGGGKVKVFEQLTVKFRAELVTDVLDATDVPDNLVAGAKGETVAHKRAPLLTDVPSVEPDVDRRVGKLLEKAQAVEESCLHVLFQALHVERVPIHEVRYHYAGKGRRLWVYGTDFRVHAPDAPWRSQRLWGILLGIVGAIALILLLIVLLASRG